MIVLLRNRIMSSWANLKTVPLKKQEPIVRSYFSSTSNDYATSTLAFLYSFLYTQRNADPFYIYDSEGYFQPLLKSSPVLHFLKQEPSSGANFFSDMTQTMPILNSMNLMSIKRGIAGVLQYNNQTFQKVESILSSFGLLKKTFDVGIVLDVSGCVPVVISGLKTFQRRSGKKTMNIFVMTDSMELLREFAMSGDPSWTYVSMMRNNAPKDKEYQLTKTLAELKVMQDIEQLAFRFASPLGKLLYLTSTKVNMESQVISIDGASWKAF